MTKLHTYLNFAGNAEEAFGFYRSVFGGEFTSLMRFKDMPGADDQVAAEDLDKLMHVSLPVGDDSVLMASDVIGAMASDHVTGTNISISVHPDSREEADRIFGALAEGGEVSMPIADQFWGDYYGSLTDRYGINWMVNYGTQPEG